MNDKPELYVGQIEAYAEELADAIALSQEAERTWRRKVLVKARERGSLNRGEAMLDSQNGPGMLDRLGDKYLLIGVLAAEDFEALADARAAVKAVETKIEHLEDDVFEASVGEVIVPDPMKWGEIEERVQALVDVLTKIDELLDSPNLKVDKLADVQALNLKLLNSLQEVQLVFDSREWVELLFENATKIYAYNVILFTGWDEIFSLAMLSKTGLEWIKQYPASTASPGWIAQAREALSKIQIPQLA